MRKFYKCSELSKKDPRDAVVNIRKLIAEESKESSEQEDANIVPKGPKDCKQVS